MLLALSQTLFRRRLTRAIALPISLLLMLSGVSIWQVTLLLSALRLVDHTDRVIAQAHYTQKLLLDMETGFRGYLLTGRQEFLEPYQQANSKIDSNLDALKKAVAYKPIQVARVHDLIIRSQQWEEMIPPALARKQRGEPEPLIALRNRKRRMDGMREVITTLITTEEQLRNQRSQRAQQTTQLVILTSLSLTLGVSAILAYFIRRQILEVSRTYENALQTAHIRTKELEQSTAALQQSTQRLETLHGIDRAILAAETDEILISAALLQLQQILPFQQAFVTVFDSETGTATILAGVSETGELQPPEETEFAIADFRPEESLLNGVRYVENLATLPASGPLVLRRLQASGFSSCVCVSLLVEDTLIGELNLASTQSDAFDEEAQQIAREVGAQLAIALQQTRLRQQLQDYAAQLEQRVADRTAQLEETNQELEAFTYSVSHDLRAPLRTIQGFAVALQEDCSKQLEDFCKSYIDSIIDDAVQMNQLISDLLNYSRLTRTQINLQPTSLKDVIDEALRQLTTEIQEHQAQIQIQTPLPQVIAHRATLVQVVVNLINNAIKFVPPDTYPEINIFTEEDDQNGGNWIQLSIVDNGIGIAPEHQERVFRVFERLHGVESYPGTGIGLAIVRKGLERMGGRVGIESQLGRGSRFWISLPKAILAVN